MGYSDEHQCPKFQHFSNLSSKLCPIISPQGQLQQFYSLTVIKASLKLFQNQQTKQKNRKSKIRGAQIKCINVLLCCKLQIQYRLTLIGEEDREKKKVKIVNLWVKMKLMIEITQNMITNMKNVKEVLKNTPTSKVWGGHDPICKCIRLRNFTKYGWFWLNKALIQLLQYFNRMKVEQNQPLNNRAQNSKKQYFVILKVMNKRFKVYTCDIKKLYRTGRKKTPKIPKFSTFGSKQFSTDADHEDNMEKL